MRHRLAVTVALKSPVHHCLARFRESPQLWLPVPVERKSDTEWRMYLWGSNIGVLVDCVVGAAVRVGGTTTRRMEWRPLGRRGDGDRALVPSFDGDIVLLDRFDGVAELSLLGVYQPPGGLIGALLDRLALRHMARRTARTFLHDVATRLQEPAAARA